MAEADTSAYILQAALERAEIQNRTYRVCSGEGALAFLCKSGAFADAPTPGLVIVDLQLPRIDGWMVLSAMKRQAETREIPVLVLSYEEVESERSRAMQMGAVGYIAKQPTVEGMSRAIVEACGDFLSFEVRLERAWNYTLRAASVAFERIPDNGVVMNVTSVLPEGSQVRLTGTDVSACLAHVQHNERKLWMSLQDFRDRAIASEIIPPDSPAAQCP